MADDVVEGRLDLLTREIGTLKSRLDKLDERFDALEARFPSTAVNQVVAPYPVEETYTPLAELDSDTVFSWMGSSSLLPRITAICFILVFALVLRTLTDNEIIGRQLGSFIGMGYAAVLIGWGTRLLARENRLAIVFFVSGILLMYSIAWETHVRFESVSSLSVFAILTALLTLASAISVRFNHTGINGLAILGTSFLALIIDLPNPAFVPLTIFFLVANAMAYRAAKRLGRGEGIRFVVFLLTACVWLIWVFKLRSAFTISNVALTPRLAVDWYLPALLIFILLYMAMPIHWFLREEKSSFLDFLLPCISAFWSYSMAYLFIEGIYGSLDFLGYCGILLGMISFGIALYLYRKEIAGGAGICSFTTSGSFFLLLAFPAAVGDLLLTIPVWALLALGLARVSVACEIGGIRLTSYFIPVLACVLGIAFGRFAVDNPSPVVAISSTGILAVLSGAQYYWCRKNPISCHAGFFAVMDKADRSRIVLLAVSLVSGFCMLQIASFEILALYEGDSTNVLRGVQSILINLGAALLLLMASSGRSREILNVAVLVIVIGAFKVFGYDLFRAHGVPLVLSVLSFGVAAAVCSTVMSRWTWGREQEA